MGLYVQDFEENSNDLLYKEVKLNLNERAVTLADVMERAKEVSDPRITEMHNQYSGRIWMIGNGPSLASTPLELLEGEYSFGMNGISLIYPNTSWRPSFYMCISSNTRFEYRMPVFQASVDLEIPCFISQAYRDKFVDHGNIRWIYSPPSRRSNGEQVQGWSALCDHIVWRYSTSMFLSVQLATYLGFTEIILLGCDMGWKEMLDTGVDPNHFSESYSAGTTNLSVMRAYRVNREMLSAHRIMLEMSKKLDFKIYNATLGGELEIHPRVDMLTVLESGRV